MGGSRGSRLKHLQGRRFKAAAQQPEQRAAGHHVTEAHNGREAVNIAQDQAFDLILMDIGLPGIDGIETTLKIKQSQNPNRKIPVVAITAHTDDTTRQQCFDADMVGFLVKPFSYTEMQIVLERLKLL